MLQKIGQVFSASYLQTNESTGGKGFRTPVCGESVVKLIFFSLALKGLDFKSSFLFKESVLFLRVRNSSSRHIGFPFSYSSLKSFLKELPCFGSH